MIKKKIVCGLLAAATLIYNQPRIDAYAEEEIQEEIILEENIEETEQNSETVENEEDEVVEEETVNEEILNEEPENTETEEETKSYTVTLENCEIIDDEGNKVELESAEAGQILKLRFVAKDAVRDEFSKWTVLTENGETVEVVDDALEMPEANITVTAEYDTYYQISVTKASSSVEKAKAGDSVTVTFTENDSYLFDGGWTGIDGLSVKDKTAAQITFTMIESDLSIEPNVIDVTGKDGFITANGKKYYYKKGVKQTGIKVIEGKYYFFDDSGVMQTGVAKPLNNNRYYLYDMNGVLQNSEGWHKIADIWYYTDKNGAVKTGWQQVKNTWYYFNSKGEMQTGFQKINGKTYYLRASGAMQTGWAEINKKWYFFKDSGAMVTGWLKRGEYTWYYMKSDGSMATGWQKINNKWYYMLSSGKMAIGWVQVNNKWYFLKDSGAMATGWLKRGTNTWYYLKDSGAMATGWLKLPDAWYYFRDSGVMVSDTSYAIKGKIYEFAIGGQWIDYDYYRSQARPYYLKVNRALNTMTVYAKDYQGNPVIPIKAIRVSTAIEPSNTPLGVSQIGKKYRWYYYKEDECWLQYVSFFANGVRMIHSIAYWEDDPSTLIEGEYHKLGGVASHGCIRMTVINAKWVYDNCLGGTKIEVYDNWGNPGPLGKPEVPDIWDGTGWDPTDPDPGNPYN
ncbi:MAG: L,D-transpeptidase family protein [Solobacterium sp.]|nr:L,D-transpeptidase family protein [Solobacterium sp.]